MTLPAAFADNRNMRTGRARLGTRWEAFFDIVAAATVIGVTVIMTTAGVLDDSSTAWLSITLLVAGCGLLAIRRRFPLVAAIGSIVTSALALLVPDAAIAIWVLAEVCFFTLPLRRTRKSAIAAGAVHAGVLYAGALVAFGVGPLDPLALLLPVWTGAVVAFGIALRTQQDYVDSLEESARSAATVREIEVLRHVGAERLRIARDLHDSVANSIAVINLETTTAKRHLTDDPERATTSLDLIRMLTRSTLTELSDILAVLRDDTDDPDRTVATAANIPHLVDLLAGSGMPIHTDLDPLTGLHLEPAADAALYRVTQEALTNAHRYGRGTITVTASRTNREVTLTIQNQIDPQRESHSPGFGLLGMRERVEYAAGTLHARAEGNTFIVTARLPYVAPTEENAP